jgi:hypothetical protein
MTKEEYLRTVTVTQLKQSLEEFRLELERQKRMEKLEKLKTK